MSMTLMVLTAAARWEHQSWRTGFEPLRNAQRERAVNSCHPDMHFGPTLPGGTGVLNGGNHFLGAGTRSVYDGLLPKVQKRMTHRYQFTALYALQKSLGENATVNLNDYFTGYGLVLPRHNLNVAGAVSLPFGFTISMNSCIISSTPTTPIISGIDLNGGGTTTFRLSQAVSNISYNGFNQGCGKTELAAAMASFNSTWAGKTALNGPVIPQLILPADYSLGTPIFSQDFRVTKEFRFKERYRVSVFREFFNAFNISSLLYGNFTLDTVKLREF
jgi:hypothetical protein